MTQSEEPFDTLIEKLDDAYASIDGMHLIFPAIMELVWPRLRDEIRRLTRENQVMRGFIENEASRLASDEGTLGPRAIEARDLLARLDKGEVG